MGKYDPLRRYLESQRSEQLVVSFEEIERLVGPLPRSALGHRARWANSRSHSNAVAWLDAGWELSHVDVRTRQVRLLRTRRRPTPEPAEAPKVRCDSTRQAMSDRSCPGRAGPCSVRLAWPRASSSSRAPARSGR